MADTVLRADAAQVYEYIRTLFAPEDLIQFEAYPKPHDGGGPIGRYALTAGQLNDRLIAAMQNLNGPPRWGNWYVRTNPLRTRLADRSAKDDDVALVRCLWLDLDDAPAASAQQRFEAAGWPAAHLVVASGGITRGGKGAHCFFRLARPYTLLAGQRSSVYYVREIVRAMLVAMHDDPVACNVSRLMRPAGFFNVKNPGQCEPALATIVDRQPEAECWTIEHWAETLGVALDEGAPGRSVSGARKAGTGTSAPRETGTGTGSAKAESGASPRPDLAAIVSQCAWMGRCKAHAASLAEPDWYAMLSVAAHCENGRALCHDLSAPYAGYSASETDAKIDHALQAAGPRTCKTTSESPADAEGCRKCPHWGKITSPIELGYRRKRGVTQATALNTRAGILAKAKDCPESVDALITSVLEDDWQMQNLAWLVRSAAGQFTALLEHLEHEYKVPRRRIETLEKTVKRVAEQQYRKEKNKRIREDAQATPVLDVLKDAPVNDKVVVPGGFELGPEGIAIEKHNVRDEVYYSPITATPIVVTGVLRDVETGVHHLQLAWRSGFGWRRLALARAVAAQTQEIVKPLAELGLHVHSRNKMDVVEFIDAYQAVNAGHLPRIDATSTMGWVPAAKGGGAPRFLIGRQVVSATGIVPAGGEDPLSWRPDGLLFKSRNEGDEELLDAYHAEGTLAGWLAAIAPLEAYPLAALGIYVALAAPLLVLLRQPSLIYEWADRTSTGKTTALRIAASTCGNPDEAARRRVIQPWSATANAIARMAAMLRHLPLFMDDSRKARRGQDITDVVYEFSGGAERPRAGLEGLQRAGHWQTVMLSTGEQPITDFGGDHEGSHVRAISVWGRPFGDKREETGQVVDRMRLATEEHYGHAMPVFLAWVLAHYDELAHWRELHSESRSGFVHEFREAGAKSEHLATRMAGHLATLQLAVHLVHKAIALPWDPLDVWKILGLSVLASVEGADTSRVALVALLEDAATRRAAYWDGAAMGRNQTPSAGWRGRADNEKGAPLCFAQTTIREVLGRLDIDYRRVLRTWADNQWISRDAGGSALPCVRIDGQKVRMLVVPRKTVDELLGTNKAVMEEEQRQGLSSELGLEHGT